MKPLRRKQAPTSGPRFRPANTRQRDAEAKAWLLANGYTESDTSGTGLVWLRDWHAVAIWSDDPDTHAEHAEDMAVLDEYRAMLAWGSGHEDAPAGGCGQGREGDESGR